MDELKQMVRGGCACQTSKVGTRVKCNRIFFFFCSSRLLSPMRNEGTSHYKVVKKSVISLVGGKLSEMRVDNCGFIYMQSTKLDTIWKMQLHLHVFNVII
jgi:hypothetical protein